MLNMVFSVVVDERFDFIAVCRFTASEVNSVTVSVGSCRIHFTCAAAGLRSPPSDAAATTWRDHSVVYLVWSHHGRVPYIDVFCLFSVLWCSTYRMLIMHAANLCSTWYNWSLLSALLPQWCDGKPFFHQWQHISISLWEQSEYPFLIFLIFSAFLLLTAPAGQGSIFLLSNSTENELYGENGYFTFACSTRWSVSFLFMIFI